MSLRPHHLLCLLTYIGKGYTPEFVKNYDRIVAGLNAGDAFVPVYGPDDICRPMLQEKTCHCLNDSVAERDRIAARAVAVAIGRELTTGTPQTFSAAEVAVLRSQFADGGLRGSCSGCEWQNLCTRIAENDFRGCRLAPPER